LPADVALLHGAGKFCQNTLKMLRGSATKTKTENKNPPIVIQAMGGFSYIYSQLL
jgi:hypothetical protein